MTNIQQGISNFQGRRCFWRRFVLIFHSFFTWNPKRINYFDIGYSLLEIGYYFLINLLVLLSNQVTNNTFKVGCRASPIMDVPLFIEKT